MMSFLNNILIMIINNRNKAHLEDLFLFCHLYNSYRDFELYRRLTKHNTLTYDKAESLATLCNMLVKTKTAKPTDFIKTEDEKGNNAIDKYKLLKNNLNFIKQNFGVKKRNQIHKAVKRFYRKNTFCYQMDSYFTFLIFGFYIYQKGIIDFNYFLNTYYFEVSLFDGTKKPLKIKNVIRIYANIKEHIKHYI